MSMRDRLLLPFAVQRIGLGYPGIGATTDPAGSRVVVTTLGWTTEPRS